MSGAGAERSRGGPTALRVLLIELTPEVAQRIEAALEARAPAATVRRASDRAAGREMLETFDPQVLVVDLARAERGDAKAECWWETAAPSVPVVGVVEERPDAGEKTDRAAGAVDVLHKEELTPALVTKTLRWAVEHRRMEGELRRQETWIQSMSETVSGGLFRSTPDDGITYASETFARMLGYDRPEPLLGTELADRCVDPDQRAWLRGRLSEGPLEVTLELERTDGTTIVARLSSRVVWDPEHGTPCLDGVITDVTQKMETERKLRVLSEAVEQAHEAVLITEADPHDEPGPRIVYANSAFESMTGYDEEEVLGRTPRLLQGPDTDPEVLSSLREALEAEEPWAGETINYRKDGTPFTLQWNIAPVRDEAGEVEYWVSVQRDVTEAREREAALRRQRNLLEQTQRLAGAWEIDLRTGEVAWSEEVYRIHEVPAGTDVDLETAFHFFPPEARSTLRSAIQGCVEEGNSYDLELPLITAEDNRRWVHVVGAPVKEDGEVVRVAGAIQDVTEREEAERELRRTADLLSRAEEMADLGGWLIDVSGEPPYSPVWTDKLYDLFGLSREADPLYDELFDYYHPEDRDRHREAVKRAEEEGEGWDQELRLVTADGEVRWVHNIGEPVVEDGETVEMRGALQDITDRKRVEQKLREQEARFRTLTSHVTDGIYRSVPGKGVVYANQAFAEMFGFERVEDVLQSDPRALYADPEKRRQTRRRIRAEGSLSGIEMEFRRVDGSRFYGLVSGTAVRDEEGEIVCYDGAVTDITELKRRQQGLEDRQEKIEALYMATNRLLRAEDEEEVGTSILELVRETLSYPGVSVRLVRDGQLVPVHLSPETRNLMPERPALDVDGESLLAEVYRTEDSIVMDDLQATDVEDPTDYGVTRAAAGVPLGRHGVIGIADREPNTIDAFDLRLVEILGAHAAVVLDGIERLEALEESERRFRKVFENAAVGIVIGDAEGCLLEANPAFRDMMGYEAGELRGRHFASFTHPEDVEKDRRLFRELVEGERDRYRIEKRYVRKGGEPFWARLTSSLYEGVEEGQHVALVEDIEDQKQYEEGLRAAKEEAERMNQLKSSFLANMSHEIRTPLTSILGFAEVIGEEAERLEAQVEGPHFGTLSRFSKLIEKSGRRLMDTLTGVLNFSKLEAGELQLSVEAVDLTQAATEIVDQLRPQAETEGIHLHKETGGRRVWARADEGGVHIVLRNLVSNAIKYTREGGRACVRVRREADAAVLEVEDTGIGMSDEEVSALFGPFRQGSEGLSREYEGSGLGLAVTKKMVNQMEADIEVETEKGEGSCFTVRFSPAAEPSGDTE